MQRRVFQSYDRVEVICNSLDSILVQLNWTAVLSLESNLSSVTWTIVEHQKQLEWSRYFN